MEASSSRAARPRGSERSGEVLLAAGVSRSPRDALGRAASPPGRALIAAVAARVVTCEGGVACLPRTQADHRHRCGTCGRWWSVSHVGNRWAVASSRRPLGIDLEDDRRRPRAWAVASRWCGVPVTGPSGWTQAEALWKATGKGLRTPRDGEILIPKEPGHGWLPSRDALWTIRTVARRGFTCSLALQRDHAREGASADGDQCPPEVIVLRGGDAEGEALLALFGRGTAPAKGGSIPPR